MRRWRIISPMGRGSGAYIVHRTMEGHLQDYQVMDYHPYWTLFPFLLPIAVPMKGAKLIHTTPDHAIFFSKTKIPLILTFHGYVIDGGLSPYYPWYKTIYHKTFLRFYSMLSVQKANAITAVSRFTAQLVKKDLMISRPIQVIYNGVDANRFTPANSPITLDKKVRIFYSGNLTLSKGAFMLPEIAKKLTANTCIYYTQGLRTRIKLPSSPFLKCVGPVPFEEMPKWYQGMDILLMPTIREGFSLSVLEAMACGLPVIASNCSSLLEQIDEDKGGCLCSVGDVNDFAEKINTLADSPNLRREMGEYNRAKVEKMFTLERMVNEYRDLFEEVLG